MSITSMITAASETSGEPAIHPYWVGAISFGILLALLFGLLMFGKGREHS